MFEKATMRIWAEVSSLYNAELSDSTVGHVQDSLSGAQLLSLEYSAHLTFIKNIH
jgi:hypothetical protein